MLTIRSEANITTNEALSKNAKSPAGVRTKEIVVALEDDHESLLYGDCEQLCVRLWLACLQHYLNNCQVSCNLVTEADMLSFPDHAQLTRRYELSPDTEASATVSDLIPSALSAFGSPVLATQATMVDGSLLCLTSRSITDDLRAALERLAIERGFLLIVVVNQASMICQSWSAHQRTPAGLSRRLGQTLEVALARYVMNRAMSVSKLFEITSDEFDTLVRWNSASIEQHNTNLCAVVAKQALQYPNAIAIYGEDSSYTFAEMQCHVIQLAMKLKELGVQPQSYVPFVMKKSAFSILVICAIVRAGGACVPLDPDHPKARHVSITERCTASLVITDKFSQHVTEDLGLRRILVTPDMLAPNRAQRDLQQNLEIETENILPEPQPHWAAWVIFTSGSTGVPKGVVLEHRAICSGIRDFSPVLEIGPTSRVLQFAAFTFDVSIEEIFYALGNGGCVCVPSEEDRLQDLGATMNRFKITWVDLTPSLTKLLDPSLLPHLKTVNVGGELLAKTVIDKWATCLTLKNTYGPAETSCNTTCNPNVLPGTSGRDIGRPVGCRVYIVNSKNPHELLPIGAVGEMLAEGPCLAREYIGDPEKTAKAFIGDLAWAGPGRRFYRTGDLAQLDDNGILQFLGRADTQVKIHGLRIELSEIEHHLNAHPGIRFAIAFVPQQGAAQGKLLTVVVPRYEFQGSLSDHFATIEADSPAWAQVTAAREHLKEHLPLNHIPTIWAVVKFLPMTSSLKLNLVAIKAWVASWTQETLQGFMVSDGADTNGDPEYAEDLVSLLQPRAQDLKTITATVLNLTEAMVSMNKSFISLGGDSLLAMQIVTGYRAMGWQVSVAEILRCPTLAQIAEKATALEFQVDYTEQLANLDMSAPFDMSPIQQSHFNMQPHGRNDFTLGFRLDVKKRGITAEQLESSLRLIVEKHAMLRARAFQDSSGTWKQTIQPTAAGSFSVHWHMNVDRQTAEEIVEHNETSLDFRDGPILAADMIIRDSDVSVLCLTVHHLFIDLISWRVILDDLNDTLAGKPIQSDSSLSFPQWLTLQQKHFETASLSAPLKSMTVNEADLSFWGMEHRQNLYEDVVVDEFTISETITSQILGPCNMTYSSEPVELLLAALHHSFAKTFPERGLLHMFNEDHGRDPWDPNIDISRTVGWFTTLSPICLEECERMNVDAFVQDTTQARLRINPCEYFSARYLHTEGRTMFEAHNIMELLFNYTGSFQQLETNESILAHIQNEEGDQSFHEVQSGQRDALVEITALAEYGRLRFVVETNRHMLHRNRISTWMNEIQRSLQTISEELYNRGSLLCAARFPLLGNLNSQQFGDMLASVHLVTGIKDEKNIEDIYPVTPMQHGILLSQAQDRSLYHVHSIWELQTTDASIFDASRLIQAWKSVVARQSILRTVFIEVGDAHHSFYQVVLKQVEAAIAFIGTDQPLSCLEHYREDMSAHKELGHRLIIAASSSQVYCRLDISHTLMDGFSMSILERDLKSAYQSHGLSLGGNRPSFGRFVGYNLGLSSKDSISHWGNYLVGADPCLFPSLAHRAPADTQRLRVTTVVDLSDIDVSRFCRDNNVTMSNVVSTAWAMVLRLYTGKNDVCFGYLVSGRDIPVPDIEDMVGPCISMLVQRLSVEDSLSLKDLLLTAQEDNLTNMQHLGCSLAEIIGSTGSKTRTLFNTVISYQRVSSSDAMIGYEGLQMTEVSSVDPAEYDISLGFFEENSRLSLKISYWDTFLDEPSVESLGCTLKQAVSRLVEASGVNIGACSLISPHDRLLLHQNNINVPKRIFRCIQDVIGDHAARCPNAVALHSKDLTFTYSQLANASDRLAMHLIACGISKGDFVALCFQKSPWATISALAVMKSGAAYGWIDYDAPTERCQALVSKLAAVLVLGDAITTMKFQGIASTLVIHENSDIILHPDINTATELPVVSPLDTAFVLFTSGSSGEPKGASIQHFAMVSSSYAHGKAQSVGPSTRAYQFAAYTFDVATADIFTTLMSGGCVCIPAEADRLNNLAESIRDLDCNWAHLTPSVARILNPASVPRLETLVVGGEALPEDVIASWSGHLNLVNTYGPAECSVTAACYANITTDSTPGSIGVPVGTRLWIVDPKNHDVLLPNGCIGEILIEGWGLASCYIHDETKTSQTFIQNPVWSLTDIEVEQRRFYKTGDLARWNWAGELIFSGRKDSMVKLRGLKIEISQIETKLIELLPPNWVCAVDIGRVSESATDETVIAFICDPFDSSMQDSGNGSLIATPLTSEKVGLITNLRKDLMNSLPAFMVPTVYLPLKVMPMTASRKVNRRHLRDIARKVEKEELALCRAQLSDHPIVPLTEGQKILAILWAECLSLPLELISADSHFFQIGGDSLTAMKVVILANKQKIPLRVTSIFQNPTLGALAAVYEQFRVDRGSDLANGVQSQFLEPPQPFKLLNLTQERQTALLCELADLFSVPAELIENAFPATPLQETVMASASHQPGAFMLQEVVELHEGIDTDKLREAWSQVVEATPMLRTRMCQSSICPDLLIQTVISESFQWQHIESDLSDYLSQDSNDPMSVGDRLVRWVIVRDSVQDKKYLVWSISHCLYDGESRSMIWSRVEAAYENGSYASGPSFDLFVHHQQHNSESAQSSDFWKSFLHQSNVDSFPPPPAASEDMGVTGEISFNCHMPVTSQNTVTQATLVRAAWCLLLSFYTGSEDVITGLTLTERNGHIQSIEDMIGPLVAVVPLRVQPKRELTVSQYLRQLQDDLLSMVEHQHYGMANIAKLSKDSEAACSSIRNMLNISVASESPGSQDGPLTSLKRIDQGASLQFDTMPLVIDCVLRKSKLSIVCRFNEECFSNSQIERLLFQLRDIIDALGSADGSHKLSDIPMYSEEDQMNFQTAYDQSLPTVGESLPALLSKHHVLNSDSEVILSWDGSLAGNQLQSLSTALAIKLMHMGTKRGDLVPVCFEKSMWMIVAQLAVLKAGAAFVPLDPSFPIARLRNIVQQSSACVTLCSTRNYNISKELGLSAFEVSAQSIAHLNQSIEDATNSKQLPDVQAADAAYVLFTSGSTGTPKGVVVSHGALCSSIMAHGEAMGFGPDTRMLQFCAYTFDVHLAEVWTTLVWGGTVCVPSDAMRSNIVACINEFKASSAMLVPTITRLFGPSDVPTLKSLCLGGERLGEDTVESWASEVTLINGYGPTEAAILSILKRGAVDSKSIGTPVGCRAWIVDPNDHNRLSGIGMVGELLLEGPILANGYLNDATKTDASFVKDPLWSKAFGPSEHRRFYKTGDLVQQDPRGHFNYVARKGDDTQVKVRGLRIELTEIEQVIQTEACVQQAASLLPTSGPCSGRLVGVVCLASSSTGTQSGSGIQQFDGKSFDQELRSIWESSSRALPHYMVPSTWYVVKSLPQLSSGKLDRKAVKLFVEEMSNFEWCINLWGSPSHGNEKNFRAPVTEQEIYLLEACRSILKPEESSQLSISSSFISLGGDSIGAMKLVASCSRAGWRVTVKEIIQSKSLIQLAAKMERSSTIAETLPATLPKHEEEILTVLQKDMIRSLQQSRDSYRLHTVWEFKSGHNEPLDVDKFAQAWRVVMAHHPALLSALKQRADGIMQLAPRIGDLAPITDVLPVSDGNFPDRPSLEYLEGQPLCHVSIMPRTTGAIAVRVDICHIIFDGVSWSIIMQDLKIAMRCGHLHQTAASKTLARNPALYSLDSKAEKHWSQYLKDLPECALRITKAIPSGLHSRGNLSIVLNTEVCRNFCRNAEITTANLFHASWSLVLFSFSPNTSENSVHDVSFQYLVSARMGQDGRYDASTVGCGIDLLPQRCQISSDTTVTDLCRWIRDDYVGNSVQSRSSELLSYHRHHNKTGGRLWNSMINFRKFIGVPSLDDQQQGEEEMGLQNQRLSGADPWDFPIVLQIHEEETGIEIVLEYDRTCVSEELARSVQCRLEESVARIFSGQYMTAGAVISEERRKIMT